MNEHYENGDPGDTECAQIHPHPYCNFCKKYFFNDIDLQSHLFKEHMTCTICGDDYKNWYYSDYKSLEKHFDRTHFLCKNKQCLKSLFVAFKTEDELATHNYMVHQKGGFDASKKVEESKLLGFNSFGPNSHKSRYEEIKFKDEEAIDFSWYFSDEYKAKDFKNQPKPRSQKQHHRHRNKHNHKEESKLKPIGDLPNDEEKVDKILKATRKYLKDTITDPKQIPDEDRYIDKKTTTHLYKIIGRLTPEKFVKYDFLMNFKVSIESKILLQNAVATA